MGAKERRKGGRRKDSGVKVQGSMRAEGRMSTPPVVERPWIGEAAGPERCDEVKTLTYSLRQGCRTRHQGLPKRHRLVCPSCLRSYGRRRYFPQQHGAIHDVRGREYRGGPVRCVHSISCLTASLPCAAALPSIWLLGRCRGCQKTGKQDGQDAKWLTYRSEQL